MVSRTRDPLLGLIIWLLQTAASEPNRADLIKLLSNTSYTDKANGGLTSIFSPRMDFEQWKPLTGRGDPLRNDPTYDYEPPVLERVHYWADDTRLEREHYPERKSEVLVLGISSRKPSVVSRPPMPPSRRPHRPPPPKYEEFTYKFGDHYPMTILVPPPLPPPGHKPSLFILPHEKLPLPTPPIKLTESTLMTRDTTTTPDLITSYALQEASLIYQSSTTNQNWLMEYNKTKSSTHNAVSSDYAGWGPTTPFEDVEANHTHNLINHEQSIDLINRPYVFYKPMLSESPPPPRLTPNPLLMHTFTSSTIPPTLSTFTDTHATWATAENINEIVTDNKNDYEETTTEKASSTFLPTPSPLTDTKLNIVDMLGPLMTMPMVTDPDRPEDKLYAHASETVQVFKEKNTDSINKLQVMQTMQPPPPIKSLEVTSSPKQPYHVNPQHLNNLLHVKPISSTLDPYFNMRYTTSSTTTTTVSSPQYVGPTTESPSIPYLIIQGHSKVKTYGSKPKDTAHHGLSNEIPKPYETNEVKHLHPLKEKYIRKVDKTDSNRASRAHNLKTLIDNGLGSIEIQETDVGIKYDVSDGSDVPIEIYRKGIVDSDENNYTVPKKVSAKITNNKRYKRQLDLADLLPFDEDTLEEYVYNFFEGKRNATGITGIVAQAVTSDITDDDIDDDDNGENEDR